MWTALGRWLLPVRRLFARTRRRTGGTWTALGRWRQLAAWLVWGLLAAALLACGGAVAAREEQGAGRAAVLARLDVERIAREATWAPGQLQAHFEKHGREGSHATAQAYDASARETIRIGQPFTYVDRTARVGRLGFYDKSNNRFTAVTEDGRRITTHFRPDTGERYVRGLPESTYR